MKINIQELFKVKKEIQDKESTLVTFDDVSNQSNTAEIYKARKSYKEQINDNNLPIGEKNSAGQNFSELVVQPITGRTHQIRLHLKEMGYPILGDRFYGNADCHDKNDRLNLHAVSLSFYHKSFGYRLRLSTDFNLAC